jgi:hypothetical protein
MIAHNDEHHTFSLTVMVSMSTNMCATCSGAMEFVAAKSEKEQTDREA